MQHVCVRCDECDCCGCCFDATVNSASNGADPAVQGRELLWATGESALRVAIMETIMHCSDPSAKAAACVASGHVQSGEEDRQKLLSREENFT